MAGGCNIALDCNLVGRDTVSQHAGSQQAGKEPKKLAAKLEYKFADDSELSAIEVTAVPAGSIRSANDAAWARRSRQPSPLCGGRRPSRRTAAEHEGRSCEGEDMVPQEAAEPAEPSGRGPPPKRMLCT